MRRTLLVFVALFIQTTSLAFSAESDDLNRAVRTARLLRRQGRIREAEKQCLTALEQMDLSATSKGQQMTVLAELGLVYLVQGRFPEAQQNYERALSLAEAASMSSNEMEAVLSNMAQAYRGQGRYDDAIRLLRRSLGIEGQHGNQTRQRPFTLAMLGSVYLDQRRYPEAERLFREAVDLMRMSLGPADQDTAVALSDLGEALRAQHKLASAEEVLQEVFAIQRRISPDHPNLAITLSNLAGLRTDQGHYGEAEGLLREAAGMQQNALGSGHPQFALTLYRLARVYMFQERFFDAKAPMEQAIAIFERTRVATHPGNLEALSEYARLLRKIGRKPEARAIKKKLTAIKATGNVDNFGGHTVDVHALR